MSDLFVRIRLASIVKRVRSLRCPAFYPVIDLDYGHTILLHATGASAYDERGTLAYRIVQDSEGRYTVLAATKEGPNGRRTSSEGDYG